MSRIVSIVTTLVGVLLLVALVRQVGVNAVLSGARQVGWGFIIIVLISGGRILVRAAAWRLCLDPPDTAAVPLSHAFAAGLPAEAIGSLTPLGLLASEPAKAAWVRASVPFGRAMAAVAIENVLYSISVAIVIAAGTIALLASFNLPAAVRQAGELSLAFVAAAFVALVAALWIAARRFAIFSAVAERFTGSGRLGARIRGYEARAQQAVRATRGRILPIATLEALFHAGGVAEAYVTVWLLTGVAPTVLAAFVLETANRVVNVVFRFVPLRLGVDEAGSALITSVLGLGTASGVTLAVVRKARVLFWSTAGIALMLRRGLRLRMLIRGDAPETGRS
ncbi:MAG TPA: lysylphosphatidylglycerol synthase domain-containing protein [Vicinamibacterales bacterium]|nr:lysylphosphatidylglycerol synthase domain-containing protein [Vicinamibacterales bacterium]